MLTYGVVNFLSTQADPIHHMGLRGDFFIGWAVGEENLNDLSNPVQSMDGCPILCITKEFIPL